MSNEDQKPTAGPPDNVEASELWTLLTTLPLAHRVVDYPRNLPGTEQAIGKIAIVPLDQQATIEAQIAAELYTRDVLKDRKTGNVPKDGTTTRGYEEIYKNEAAAQVLYRACRVPGSLEKNAFPAPGMLKKRLSADEIGVLVAHYNRTRVECGPILATMSEEEKDAWLDRLEVGGSEFPFDLLSSGLKDELLMRSVERLRQLRTANSSPGGQPGGPSSDSPQQTQSDEPEVPVDAAPDVAVDSAPVVTP